MQVVNVKGNSLQKGTKAVWWSKWLALLTTTEQAGEEQYLCDPIPPVTSQSARSRRGWAVQYRLAHCWPAAFRPEPYFLALSAECQTRCLAAIYFGPSGAEKLDPEERERFFRAVKKSLARRRRVLCWVEGWLSLAVVCRTFLSSGLRNFEEEVYKSDALIRQGQVGGGVGNIYTM